MTANDERATARIIRSLAFVPAHDEDAIFTAAGAGLDAVVLDFEDSTPRADKPAARAGFADVARKLVEQGVVVMARANGLGHGAEEDLEAIVGAELHCLNLPKVESADQVKEYDRLLGWAEVANGVAEGSTFMRPVIETAAGIKWAYEIASASPRVEYMGGVAGTRWGDFGATLGLIESPDAMETFYLRSKIVVDVRAAGARFPIGGGPTFRKDLDWIRTFTMQNKHLGYTGSYTLAQPEIVAVVNEVYTPTKFEIAEYLELVPELEIAEAEGKVAYSSGPRIMDTAALPWLREKLALARRLGLVPA